MADNYSESATSQDHGRSPDDILKEARARFDLACEAEKENKRKAIEDLRFADGDQWDPEIESARKADSRPCFTINRLPQHIRQVTNDQRQNRPSIKVHPVDDNADPETAQIYSGIIRHIEYNSNADTAYDTGFEGAVRGGFGYWRVITDYVSPLSFDQEILIKRIRNPLSVVFDPYSQEPDGSDACYAFVTDDVSKDYYMRLYPDSDLASPGYWENIGNHEPDWFENGSARIVEYFYKEYRSADIVLLSNGTVIEKSDLESEMASLALKNPGQPVSVTVVGERKTKIPYIRWCKFNACEILDQREWPGSFIPIVPIYGEELDINGKRILKGIVRDAKDPQRLVNYWKSAEAETIALAPKAPWIAEEDQLEGYESDWELANQRNFPFLKYKLKSINGTPLPPPSRQVFEPAVQAITQAAMLAADDLKATTGIYDASLGAKSNETSGIAIQRRNVQAQTSNFHFVDNLTRSLRHTGRILVDLIPKIYDAPRAVRIIGEDREPEIVRVNEEFNRKGKLVTYDLSAGKYDVTVDVGPSYASKRQEAAASMLDVTKAVPQIMPIVGDLLVKNMDWPGAQEISDRLKKMLPPQLQDQPNGKQQIPPQIQAQVQSQGQLIERLTSKVNELQEEKEQKLIEIESKERIEFAKIKSNETIELAKLDAKDAIELLNAEIRGIEQRLDLLKSSQPIEDESQEFAPAAGGMTPAYGGDEGATIPTGGTSPGTSIEGNNDAE